MCARVTRPFRTGGHESVKGLARETSFGPDVHAGVACERGVVEDKPEAPFTCSILSMAACI